MRFRLFQSSTERAEDGMMLQPAQRDTDHPPGPNRVRAQSRHLRGWRRPVASRSTARPVCSALHGVSGSLLSAADDAGLLGRSVRRRVLLMDRRGGAVSRLEYRAADGPVSEASIGLFTRSE